MRGCKGVDVDSKDVEVGVAGVGIRVLVEREAGVSVGTLIGVAVGVDVGRSGEVGEGCVSWAWTLPLQAVSTVIRISIQLHRGAFSHIIVISNLFFSLQSVGWPTPPVQSAPGSGVKRPL